MGETTDKILGLAYRNRGYEDDEKREKEINGEKTKAPSDVTKRQSRVEKSEQEISSKGIDNKDVALNHTKEKRNSDEGDDEVPDGGWGWIVAAGGFLGQMVVNTLVSCFGILYSELLLDLGTSALVTSWIFNLMGFMMTFTGIFVRALVEEFGFRKTTFIGTLLAFVGTVATAFTTSPWFLMFFYSFVAGTGNGIIAPLTYAVVPYYFKKRLGVANAIMSSGVSAGQIVGPLLITQLQTQYGYKGATLILGAFILQSCIGATAFHPIEWHKKKPRVLPKKASDNPGGFRLAFRILKSTLGNLKLLKSPVATIVAVGGTLNVIGYLNVLIIVPFAMQEAGLSVNNAAQVLTVSGITNLVTRLFVSVMADFSWFNMRIAYMVGTAVVVIFSVVFCFLTDLTAMMVVMGIWGCGVGIYMGLFNLVMVKYVGRENLMAELGLTCFISSAWFLACGPIVGVIRDASGSYSVSIYTLAGTIGITLILYLFLPTALAYEQRKREKQEKDQESR